MEMDGLLYVIGGFDGNESLDLVEVSTVSRNARLLSEHVARSSIQLQGAGLASRTCVIVATVVLLLRSMVMQLPSWRAW